MKHLLPDLMIRPARRADLAALTELLRLLFSIEEDFDCNPARQQRGLEMLLDHEDAVVLVAENCGRVIGMCSGQVTISTAEGGAALLVEDVVVAKEWRGMGVGSNLMTALEQWAHKRKIQRLQLLADKNNAPGLRFYQAIGWQNTALVCLRRRLPDAAAENE